jgi:hypothetical protein
MKTFARFWILICYFAAFATCSHSTILRDGMTVTKDYFLEKRFNLDEISRLDDHQIHEYLKSLGAQIFEYYKIPAISFIVPDTFEAQGMVSFGENTIYISRGMLYAIKNEAELVALLAHEVGHVHLGHAQRENDELDFVKNIFDDLSDFESKEFVLDQIKELDNSQFSKSLELESDIFGAMTAYKLGYNPYEFANLLQRLSELADPSVLEKLSHFGGTHFTLLKRAELIRAELNKANIKPNGELNADKYLINVRHLGEVKDSKKAILARQKLKP